MFKKCKSSKRNKDNIEDPRKIVQKNKRKEKNSKVGASLVSQDHPSFSSKRGFKACYCNISKGFSWCRTCALWVQARDCRINANRCSLYATNLSRSMLVSSFKRLSTRRKGFTVLRRKTSPTRNRLRTEHTLSPPESLTYITFSSRLLCLFKWR